LKKYEAYQKYNATFPSTWRARNCSSIVPLPMTLAYSAFERRIANSVNPITRC